MDVQTARAILSEVAEGGWLDRELPENETDLIDLAQMYVDEARLWVEEGNPTDSNLNAIIALSDSPSVLSESADNTNEIGTPPGESALSGYDYGTYIGSEDYERDKKVRETYPRRSSGGYSESDLREFPIPAAIPETELDMPSDLTEVGDKAVRRLYSAFNSYHGRARWMLATASSNLANATHLRDNAYRTEYIAEKRGASIREEKLTINDLETLAKSSEMYKEWDTRVNEHEQEVIHWRALMEIYGKNVEVLSREWTMRTEQYERER